MYLAYVFVRLGFRPHKDMDCPLRGYAGQGRHHCGPPADGGVVGHDEGHIHQRKNGCHQAFGLAQGYPEGGAQHQTGLDGKVRVTRLSPGRGAGSSFPQSNGLRGKPERQAATLLQAGFVFRPVGDGEFSSGDVVSLSGVVFMRHCLRMSEWADVDDNRLAICAPTRKAIQT